MTAKGSSRFKSGRVWLVTLAALLALGGCADKTGWVPVSNPGLMAWSDDGDRAGLEFAVLQSIQYYRKIPPATKFQIGPDTYTAEEMALSLELFLAILRESPDTATFQARLGQKFKVVETRREEGDNLLTGYYAPSIPGSRKPTAEFNTPLLARPDNLLVVDLEKFGVETTPRRSLVGRVEGNRITPFFTRKEIQEKNVLKDQAKVLAWVRPLDLYFLQIQGSGVIQFPDGSRLVAGYDVSNGHPYRNIGQVLINREVITREEMSMQAIRAYLEANPKQMHGILNKNPSYVFFRELKGSPLGNIQVPLTPLRSVAMDDKLIPKGALVYVDTEVPSPNAPDQRPRMRRFMLIQDTGGAIRGHGRADVYWGEGDQAELMAGHMRHPGRLFVVVARREYLKPSVVHNP
ncbi:MAG: MltA domain-containing protein [Deltaproteobacteria bacterium]|nr:MltA domain-containing protein [Deltaproteobacteria bacterium]MDH4122048.1 MltA domain-containing protein [Deltaproteobacteria bacterium]